jgi:hypothetical protein
MRCLFPQALISLEVLEQRYQYAFYLHADDDSYVRLDLMLQLLVRELLHTLWSQGAVADSVEGAVADNLLAGTSEFGYQRSNCCPGLALVLCSCRSTCICCRAVVHCSTFKVVE